jgi:uncharacterized membrane protein YGL010W
MYLNATYLASYNSAALPGIHSNLRFLTYMHAMSWIMQFIGHGFAEKRAPALLDNLLSGECAAPLPGAVAEPVISVGPRAVL